MMEFNFEDEGAVLAVRTVVGEDTSERAAKRALDYLLEADINNTKALVELPLDTVVGMIDTAMRANTISAGAGQLIKKLRHKLSPREAIACCAAAV